MNGDYKILNNGQLVVEYWEGNVAFDEFIEHEKNHAADLSITVGSSCLVDMRKISTDISIHQISTVATISVNGPRGPLHRKIAMVCAENHTFTKSQMYELNICKHGVNIITFTSLPVACAWLNADQLSVSNALDELALEYKQYLLSETKKHDAQRVA